MPRPRPLLPALLPALAALAALATLAPPTAARADLTFAAIRAATDWAEHATRKHADAGTVEVLYQKLDGVHCFQGRATVDVEPAVMLEVAMDIEGTPQWATTANVSEAKLLSTTGTVLEYYQLLDVPGWTLSKDRFWFVRGRVVREGGAVGFAWEKLDEGAPHGAVYADFVEAHPKAIEPPVNAGGWLFTPGDDGTLINYYICTDSGGEIPEKLQSLATSSTLPDTVGDLVREARRRSQ